MFREQRRSALLERHTEGADELLVRAGELGSVSAAHTWM